MNRFQLLKNINRAEVEKTCVDMGNWVQETHYPWESFFRFFNKKNRARFDAVRKNGMLVVLL